MKENGNVSEYLVVQALLIPCLGLSNPVDWA